MKSIKKNNSQDFHIVKIKNFREVVQYMYYRFVEYYKRKEGWNSPYKFSGFTLLAILLMFNVGSIVFLLETTPFRIDLGLEIPPVLFNELRWLGKIVIGGTIAIISSVVIYSIMGKISYEEIYNKFQKETPKQRKKRKWFIIGYIIFSVLFFISSVLIMEIHRNL